MPELIASLTERLRSVTIRRGAVDSLPFLQDVFTDVPGENGSFVWAHRLALTYDTRNSSVTPTAGRSAKYLSRWLMRQSVARLRSSAMVWKEAGYGRILASA